MRNRLLGLALLLISPAACGSSSPPIQLADLSGTAATMDLAATPDLAPLDAAPQRGLLCGGAPCDTPNGKVCCERPMQGCMAPPCAPGVQTDACDGPEDCPAPQVCCLQIAPVFGTACTLGCTQSGNQRGIVCHSRADCDPGQICCALETAGGLRGCLVGTPIPQCN